MTRALRAAAVVVAACGLAAGCGSSNGAAAGRPTASLTVAYQASGPGSPPHVWTLTCGPPGGTHPRPASACRELAAHAGLLRPTSGACPLLLRRGAPQSLVRGRVGTRHVDRLVRPGCDAAWTALPVLLTGR